jgi:hypothetical protein
MLICRSWVFARAWSLLSECRWNWTYSEQAIVEQMSVTFLFLPSPNSKLSSLSHISTTLIPLLHSFCIAISIEIFFPLPPKMSKL